MRILLIDDDPGTTENLLECLEAQRHEVKVLNWVDEKGEVLREALERFQPQGAILDFDMAPNGLRVYGWINEWNESISPVFYTKYAGSPPHRMRMIEAGASPGAIVMKTEAADDIADLLEALRQSDDS